MKLTINGQKLKKLVDVINHATCPDIRLHFEEDRIWFRRLDTSNVSLIDVELSSAAFIDYEFISDPFTACLDFGVLYGLKHLVGPIMELQHFDKFKFSNMIGGGFNLSELKSEHVKKDANFPDFSFLTHQFVVKASTLKSISLAAKRVSEKVLITAKPGEVIISSSDAATEAYETVSNCVGEGRVDSYISADYIYNCVRHLTGMIEVHCGNDHPIKMINEPFDGCKITFLIAPRIETE